MLAYVLGVAGIYRLVRARASMAAASLAAAIYAFNPSMLYMQSTAMTESIFLAAIIWSLVYFDDFLRGPLQRIPARPRHPRVASHRTLRNVSRGRHLHPL